jgi:CRISPR-associated exonuclease Cas4
MNKNPIITGTQINYYFVCKRKLWLFSKNITMEQNSELVEIGSLIHNSTYKRKKKEIQFDGIKIDFFEKNSGIIHEVKKSKAIEDAHIWQLKYYLYYFKKLGLNIKGKINYPVIRKTEEVNLSEDDTEKIKSIISKINSIVLSKNIPERISKKFCKKCSYFELCYA